MAITKDDGSIVAVEVERADTILKQVVGLMFRKSVPESYAMVFTMKRDNREGIHMLFVRFPIDVVFLDQNKKILDIHRNLKPWTGLAFSKQGIPLCAWRCPRASGRASLKKAKGSTGDRLKSKISRYLRGQSGNMSVARLKYSMYNAEAGLCWV